jgi:hypothetical protein
MSTAGAATLRAARAKRLGAQGADAPAHLTPLSPHSRPHSPCTHPSRCACPSACVCAGAQHKPAPRPAWEEAAARVTAIA